MKSDKAAHYFHGKEGYNCAQAVLKAFQPESGMSEITIRSATVAGGGRAKEGVCGALYAAQIILGPGEASDQITESFQQNTGSVRCSDIRKSECGCRGFVAMVSDLATPHLEKINGQDEEYRSAREVREVEMLPQVKE